MTPRDAVAGNAEATALRRAGGEEDGLEALLLEVAQGEVAAHDGVEPKLDAEPDDPVDLGAQRLARQAVLGDADGHHAAGDRHRLEDRDAIAEAGEVVGGRHAGRSAADDGDALGAADASAGRPAAACRARRRTA